MMKDLPPPTQCRAENKMRSAGGGILTHALYPARALVPQASGSCLKNFSRFPKELVSVDNQCPCARLRENHPVIDGLPHILRVSETVNLPLIILTKRVECQCM